MTMTATTSRTSSRVNPWRSVMAPHSNQPAGGAHGLRRASLGPGPGSVSARPVADRHGAVLVRRPDVRLQPVVVLAALVVLVLLAPRVDQGVRLDERLTA